MLYIKELRRLAEMEPITKLMLCFGFLCAAGLLVPQTFCSPTPTEDTLQKNFMQSIEFWKKHDCDFPVVSMYEGNASSVDPDDFLLKSCSSTKELPNDGDFGLHFCQLFFDMSKKICRSTPISLSPMTQNLSNDVCADVKQKLDLSDPFNALVLLTQDALVCQKNCVENKKFARVCRLLIAAAIEYESVYHGGNAAIPEDTEEKEMTTLKPNVNATPKDKIITSPTERMTPAPNENVTPAPKDNVTPAPKDNVTPAPKDSVTPAPKDNVTPAPKDNMTPAPKDNVTPAPKDNVTPTPKDSVTPAPKDRVTPAPKDNVTPAPKDDNVTPAPKDNVTPAPKDSVTPAPKDNVTPAPKDNVTPAPKDNVTPAPKDNVTPAPKDSVTPAPKDSVTPAPKDNVTPAPKDNVTPAPKDNVTPAPKDNVTPAPKDSVTPAPKDSVTPAPKDNVTPAPKDNVTPAPKDNVTPAPKDNVTPAPKETTPGSKEEVTPAPKDQEGDDNTDKEQKQPVHSNNDTGIALGPGKGFEFGKSSSSSGHFLLYLICALAVVFGTYVLYHNRRKIMGYIVEGRGPGEHGQSSPSSRSNVKYKKLKPTVEMPAELDRSITTRNYIY